MSGLALALFLGTVVGGVKFVVLVLPFFGIPVPPALWGFVT